MSFSFRHSNVTLETEVIRVIYDHDYQGFDIEMTFLYGTLGCFISDHLFVYGSYWYAENDMISLLELEPDEGEEAGDTLLTSAVIRFLVPNFGIAYHVNDNLTVKAHYGRVMVKYNVHHYSARTDSDSYNLAFSVFF